MKRKDHKRRDTRDEMERLLDAGLENYSRAEPPPGFTERVKRRLEDEPPPVRELLIAGRRRRWLLTLAPVPAAAAIALAFLLQPAPLPPPPPARRAALPAPRLAFSTAPAARKAVRHAPVARAGGVPAETERSVRVLTPEELAAMEFPAQLFPLRLNNPLAVADLDVKPLTIEPLEEAGGPGRADQSR